MKERMHTEGSKDTTACGAETDQPTFAFCESVAAGGGSPWHIRRIPAGETLRLGGGITTPSLCERVKRGWDLDVRLTKHHLGHACTTCADAYRALAPASEAQKP